MSRIKYLNFDQVKPSEFILILNDDALRLHLIQHEYFDLKSVNEWMTGKIQTDSIHGCRIRAVSIDGELAGWCGIQPDDNDFELAIVISKKFWGFGITIFKTLLLWASEFGHKEIKFHLLDTRPEYLFLNKKSIKVQKTKLMGRNFTTYWISVV